MTTSVFPEAPDERSTRPSLDEMQALLARLQAAATVLLDGGDGGDRSPVATAASTVLEALVDAVRVVLTGPRMWLLLTAVGGRIPSVDIVEDGLRIFELHDSTSCTLWLLRTTLRDAVPSASRRRLELARGVVVDVGSTATDDLHTGIQRVVRSTVPIWARQHHPLLVGWWPDAAGYRHLDARERGRVETWGTSVDPGPPPPDTLVVPWEAVLVLPDAASPGQRSRLAALARFSGSRVVGIGYDCIPAVSAGLMPPGAAGEFARYLQLTKHMHRVAAISASARAEFAGFVSALPTQGLVGPLVVECRLGTDPAPPLSAAPRGSAVQVACVGSYEPRKNHLGLLHAAELLWREGLRFRLVLVGGMSWTDEIPARIAELQAAGRSLEALHAVDDARLAEIYAGSRFTVFPSLHEGYGLPIVESFAHGTPVITASHGSMAELGAEGGALLVDVRDDAALCSAMRMLITDDALLERLRADIAQRPSRTWTDYAEDLWATLVAPELVP